VTAPTLIILMVVVALTVSAARRRRRRVGSVRPPRRFLWPRLARQRHRAEAQARQLLNDLLAGAHVDAFGHLAAGVVLQPGELTWATARTHLSVAWLRHKVDDHTLPYTQATPEQVARAFEALTGRSPPPHRAARRPRPPLRPPRHHRTPRSTTRRVRRAERHLRMKTTAGAANGAGRRRRCPAPVGGVMKNLLAMQHQTAMLNPCQHVRRQRGWQPRCEN